jgi:hypothetical protein
VDAWSVVQVMVAEVGVTLPAATLLITGPAADALVWNVKLFEVDDRLLTLADTTSKL